jgi:ferredoxin-NADP reductase
VNTESIIFKEELDELAKQYSQFKYVDFILGQKRIGQEDLSGYENAIYYICGPDSLKSGIVKELRDLKVDAADINVEHFVDGYVPWFGLFQKVKTVRKNYANNKMHETKL